MHTNPNNLTQTQIGIYNNTWDMCPFVDTEEDPKNRTEMDEERIHLLNDVMKNLSSSVQISLLAISS